MKTKGNRVDHIEGDLDWPAKDAKQLDFGKDEKGRWYCWPPNCGAPVLLTGHSERKDWGVQEHEDKTITVTPSINAIGRWHGFLERGIWRDC